MTKESDITARHSVVKMRFSGKTYEEIEEKTGHNKNYVKKWVKRWGKMGSFEDAPRSGRKKKYFSNSQEGY